MNAKHCLLGSCGQPFNVENDNLASASKLDPNAQEADRSNDNIALQISLALFPLLKGINDILALPQRHSTVHELYFSMFIPSSSLVEEFPLQHPRIHQHEYWLERR